ncbi:MAG: NAD(P)H-dependent oxidoreductase [Lewinellaceae bacterium]|nr:NAD(P)H-dependent oxidoreductase [Lewinellaceae bacterium]
MHITIISGSTRLNRQSHSVALALQARINDSGIHSAEILDLAAYQFPIMEEVLHRHPNPPDGLDDFAEKIRRSDAHIFVSPEYNGSYTSALKNAVDYLKESEFSKKVIGVAAVSAGGMGGMRAALAMQQLVLGVGAYALPQMLLVGQVGQRFDADGKLLDPLFDKNMQVFLSNFSFLAEAVTEKKAALQPVTV